MHAALICYRFWFENNVLVLMSEYNNVFASIRSLMWFLFFVLTFINVPKSTTNINPLFIQSCKPSSPIINWPRSSKPFRQVENGFRIIDSFWQIIGYQIWSRMFRLRLDYRRLWNCSWTLKLKLVVAPFWQFLEVTHIVNHVCTKPLYLIWIVI